MAEEKIIFYLCLIFSGAAVMATVALFARQAMIVAYIILGIILGPSALNLVPDVNLIHAIAEIGIIFLLFLLGLNLHPQKLYKLFGRTASVTLISCGVFALTGTVFGLIAGFNAMDSILIGVAMMFSSTIIGLKLLPTTVLHHQYTGELIISILLLQDILAIIILLLIGIIGHAGQAYTTLLIPVIALPGMIILTNLLQRYLLQPLLLRFDTIQEYIFLLAIGWCLGLAELAQWLGLSMEIGAFIAGVSIAASPISTFIAESLKPLRDFFLVLFFFALGATTDITLLADILLPAVLLSIIMLAMKPFLFSLLLQRSQESSKLSREIGIRLGQISEFSLLIAMLALQQNLLSERASGLIQVATLITFIISPQLIVFRYPTPIATSTKLRRN